MTYRWLSDLDAVLTAGGVPFVEVGPSDADYTGSPDWRTRGRPASTGDFDPQGILCHHTASPAGTSDQADLNAILWGNSQAPGPISQLLIGRSGTVYLVAAGRANHGGQGIRPGLDRGCADMNAALVGIEASNNGVGEYWPDHQIAAYARTVAALTAGYGWALDAVYFHATTGPPGGGCNSKIDPAGPWAGQPHLTGSATWDLDLWRTWCVGDEPSPPLPGGADLMHTLIRVQDSYVVLAGDSDAQGIVHWCRWLGPGLNQSIGFQADNETPRLPGTIVLNRTQAELATITLVGPLPSGDLLSWSAEHFYRGG